MRLKVITGSAFAFLILASCTSTLAYTIPERRYYVSTVFSWWPTYRDMTLFHKFVDESKQKGMNSVSIDIPWTVENGKNGFDFSGPDERIDYAVSRGLSVFIRLNATTLGGETPKWLSTDMLQATPDGRPFKRETDGAVIASLSHPAVREHLARFAHAAALHYGGRYASSVSGEYPVVAVSPALDLYMESEYYPDAELDYSAAAQASFSRWVRGNYKGIADLNAKWGKKYRSWAEIRLSDAHPTAKHLFFASELASVCRIVADAVRGSGPIGVGVNAGCPWENARRRTTDPGMLVGGMDWLFISDPPAANHAFSTDYARASAPGRRISSQVDSASQAEGTNSRYFNQGVRAFEHGSSSVLLANWDLSNMRDNGRWPFLHFVGQLTRYALAHPRPEKAIYVSTWDLVNRPNSVDVYLAAYDQLSDGGKFPVDVLSDSAVTADPGRLATYREIHLPANVTIPPAVRSALSRVHGKLKVADPAKAGTLDEYGRLVKSSR